MAVQVVRELVLFPGACGGLREVIKVIGEPDSEPVAADLPPPPTPKKAATTKPAATEPVTEEE